MPDSRQDNTTEALFEYPHIVKDITFAISWCKICHNEIVNGSYQYCPWCGRKIMNWRQMTVQEFFDEGFFKK